MKMLAITCFGLLALLNLFVQGSVEEPHLTRCEGSDESIVAIEHVKITDAKLGKTAKFEVQARVKHSYGVNPILKISFARPDGEPAQCAYLVFPEELRLCGGNTDFEKEVTADWNNTCPIKEGKYTARLSVYIPDISVARECVQPPLASADVKHFSFYNSANEERVFSQIWGCITDHDAIHGQREFLGYDELSTDEDNGKFNVTLKIVDQGKTLECVSFPASIDVD